MKGISGAEGADVLSHRLGKEEDSGPHDPAGVLRSSCCVTNRSLLPGNLGNLGEHLLDTHLRKTSFGILGPGSDFAANNSGADWYCRDARQQLAL